MAIPPHYDKSIEPHAAFESWFSHEAVSGHYQMSAIEYLMRYKEKGLVGDLEKARRYVDKLILLEKAKCP